MQELASFDVNLEYLKGKNNSAANALSRLEDHLLPDEAEHLSQQMTDLNHKQKTELTASEVHDILDGPTGSAKMLSRNPRSRQMLMRKLTWLQRRGRLSNNRHRSKKLHETQRPRS